MNLILIGAPGSGKGTQAARLQRDRQLVCLSTGEMLREQVTLRTPLGVLANQVMNEGHLLPDEVVIQLVADRIAQPDCERGFLLDGFPRTLPQAEALDSLLSEHSKRIDCVIEIHVDDQFIIRRIVGRFNCTNCGEGYHDEFKPTAQPGICDVCGSPQFKRRGDDNAIAIQYRLERFHEQTRQLLPYYRSHGILRTVNGMANIEQVAQDIDAILDEMDSVVSVR